MIATTSNILTEINGAAILQFIPFGEFGDKMSTDNGIVA